MEVGGGKAGAEGGWRSGAGDMERNEERRRWIDGGKEEEPRCRKLTCPSPESQWRE